MKLSRQEKLLLAALAAGFVLAVIGLIRAVGLKDFMAGIRDPESTVGKLWRRVTAGMLFGVTAVIGVASFAAGAPFVLTAGLVGYGLYKTGAYAVGSGLLGSFLRDIGVLPAVTGGAGQAETLCAGRGGVRSVLESGMGTVVECQDGSIHNLTAGQG